MIDDFLKAIDGKEFICNTREETVERLSSITSHKTSIDPYAEGETVRLKRGGDSYTLPIGLIRPPEIERDLTQAIRDAEYYGYEAVSFHYFYQKDLIKRFEGCYIEIEYQGRPISFPGIRIL